ncbi:hypothetical protein G6F50_012861 [Rhizopus delemar]|uniref:Gamma-glutamyltransferase n=1 Tax=Rhizopus delemar TaxID=936053 RepID=A0A9P6YQB4_9FUNG|nr:hypothetical protein G6F50_012861 [Rhizopus delemar]
MQHVIERNTAVLAMSTLATEFFSVSAASSAIACGARMVAAESVSVNPNSLFSGQFLRGFRVVFALLGADLGPNPPKAFAHDLCPIPREGRSGEDRGPPFHRNLTVSRRLARTLLAAAVLATVPALSYAADRITGHTFATRSEVIAPHAMAATSQPLATQIALDVMKKGGSAVDAAIAANAALGLMEPTGNGIGGDLFAIVWDPKTQKLYGYNGSGRSPKSLTLAEFPRRGLKDIPATGPLPVSVPGAVDGWFALHERFGRTPMAENLAPAIRYAREGHPVAEVIAYYWDRSVPKLSQYPGFKEQFTINGHAPRKGEMWKHPHLASTLQKIADGGRDAFYKGDIARTIGDYFKANGGYLSYQDMADHHGEWVEPVSSSYRGYDVWELPPNSQGIAALQILNVLEGYDFSKIPFGSPEHVHLFVEAKKLAFADRARFYADMAFQPAPVQKLISKDRAHRNSWKRATPST